ncbi:MAG: hypothetical protein QOH16_2627 [Gaiellaceae bacterium]|nr:hypothetical protein [Gaiellaceae bacterium]
MGSQDSRLQRSSLASLIAQAKTSTCDDTPAMNEIVRRFEPLARRASRTITSRASLFDDLANAARFGLVRAVRRHDPSVPGFASYAARFMTGAARRELSGWIRPFDDESWENDGNMLETVGGAADESEIVDRLAPWGEGAVAEVVGALTSEQRRIVGQRYVHDASLAEIAATTGTSVPAVSQRLSTIHRKVELALAA